jgi:S-DNA-T family DNA segregation ATPase FtsK/SpoIIIE
MRWQQWLSVLPMLAGTLATALMFGGREGGSSYTYVVGGIFGLSTLGMLVLNVGGGGRRADSARGRQEYLRYLAGIRTRVRAIVTEQREALAYRNPEPATLWTEASGDRVWERRGDDADFAVVRVGVGAQSLATELIAPVIEPTVELEPVTAAALRRFLDTYAVVPDLPVSLALRSFARVVIRSEHDGGESARGLARAMVGQLCTFHAPDDLLVAACVAPDRRRDWEWLKWLPHALHPTRVDAVGPRRLVAESLADLDDLLVEVVGTRGRYASPASTRSGPNPFVVVLLDAPPRADDGLTRLGASGGLAEVVVLDLSDAARPSERSLLTLRITPGGELQGSTVDEHATIGQPDRLCGPDAEALARRLARLRLSPTVRTRAPLTADRDLTELLGIHDIATAPLAELWARRPPREALRIPIGTGGDGDRVDLDLKEAAQDGMGPHGLVVGATGSGKSELLRTLVLGLAVTHSSEALNVVLVDFKGGATFASLDQLPHTSAVITNLKDELPLVDRMNDALTGELTRRQELLRRAGNLASLREYDRARAAGAELPPLPALLLVCDEFTELLAAKPDFIDLFLQIGRVGRSLGVHLLLATQRLEEGRLRGLEANLAYRIALRTFTATESRVALGVADAADLPSSPGHGYLRVGTEALRRFKAAYVSGPYTAPPTGPAPGGQRIHPFSTGYLPLTEILVEAPAVADPLAPSLLDVMVSRLVGQGPPAHRVWLPPLAEPSTVDVLLGGLVHDRNRGVTTAEATLRGALRIPVATVDKPFDQRRDTAWLDLAGAAGHIAIVGSPQSGKSTAARTLITALALTHTPTEVQVYCLDFGGGSFATLRDLPHLGGIAGRLDTAAVRRTVGEIATLLADRERRFAARGIDSMGVFRQLRRPSDVDATVVVPEDGYGDVFLVVDGWSTLRYEYDDLEPVLADIATRGLSYGVHLIATATRWGDFRTAVKDLFGSRLELHLGDPADSMINRRLAANVPAGTPGRGLGADGLHLLTALPQAAGHPAAELYAGVNAAWSGPRAPSVRMLPDRLPYEALLAEDIPLGTGWELPVAVAEADLRPVLLDFAADAHLVCYGDRECGKSTLLRSLAESVTRRFTPEEARIVIVDYRRSLLGAITTEHLIGYGSTADSALPLLQSVAGYLDKRRPGSDVTPQQLRDRSWWTGPECFVLVDDYDLVAGGATNPLTPLLDYLAQARDVGLHLVVTRRAGGAGRAVFEPVLQRLRELGTPGLVMAGDRDEGPLVGSVRPGPQPPGRGVLVTRRDGARLVQLAHLPPAA